MYMFKCERIYTVDIARNMCKPQAYGLESIWGDKCVNVYKKSKLWK